MTSPQPPLPNADSLRQEPLNASGLPTRIVSLLLAHQLSTLGDLCQPLPEFEKLDADDRSLLARIAAYVQSVCDGQPPSLPLRDWLTLFLTPRLADAIQLHYGLQEPSALLAQHQVSLRDTGFKLGVTRERARQLLGLAHTALRNPLPLFAAEPIYRALETTLHNSGGVLDTSTLAKSNDPAWSPCSPVGTFLFLMNLSPNRLTLYRDLCGELSPTRMDHIEKALRDQLSAANRLLPITEIETSLPSSARPPNIPSASPLLLALLRHMPDTLATRDGRAGFAARDGAELLREILSIHGESPLRTLVEAFNARLYPECQRGSGYVRDVLQHDPLVRKTAPARYALPGGLQTHLSLSSPQGAGSA